MVQRSGEGSIARLQEELVSIGDFPARNFRRRSIATILSRVVFRGHAQPAVGPVSPANKFWFNAKLKPQAYAPDAALKALQAEGFRLENGTSER